MEQSDTQTLVSKSHRQWENHLSFEIRHKFITYYQEGYAVYKIATTFRVTAGTVEHHLRTAGVYIPGRKPTKRNTAIPGYAEVLERPAQAFILSAIVKKELGYKIGRVPSKLEIALEKEDRATEAMQRNFPKSYKEYLARAVKRQPNIYNGLYASTTNSFSCGNN